MITFSSVLYSSMLNLPSPFAFTNLCRCKLIRLIKTKDFCSTQENRFRRKHRGTYCTAYQMKRKIRHKAKCIVL